MPQKKWYSPQIRRDLVRGLYFKAKAQGIAMTVLANHLIESGLSRATCIDMPTPGMQKDTHTTTTLP